MKRFLFAVLTLTLGLYDVAYAAQTLTAPVKIVNSPGGTNVAPLNIGVMSTAPATPNNGDCWIVTLGMYCFANDATIGPFGSNSPLGAHSMSTVASPTFPNSTTLFTMQGLAGSFTPVRSGVVELTISGTVTEVSSGAVNLGATWKVSYGTGTAPTSNAALTGTQVGLAQTFTNPATATPGDVHVPFTIQVIVTGLTLGTPIWIDLAAESITTASDCGFQNVIITAGEI